MTTEREFSGNISEHSMTRFISDNSHSYQHKAQIRETALKISELLDGLPYGVALEVLTVLERSYKQYALRFVTNLVINTKD